jgi:esterase FrsA
MNDVTELKRFAAVHSTLQDVPAEVWQAVLDRIEHDRDGEPGSWAREWSTAAAGLRDRGEPMAACHCYVLARFPFVDGPTRAEAMHGVRAGFDQWRSAHPTIEPVAVPAPGGGPGPRCWAAGLRPTRPLLLFMGGIVSLKEQWAPLLLMADQLDMAVVVAEMPGVGENGLRYDRGSWRMLSAVLDALAGRADVARTFALATSFSGHLALRCASRDHRIRGVISNAAPVSDFFTDAGWLRALPGVTAATLAHLTGTEVPALPALLADWALSPAELAAVHVPVAYLSSTRDEVCPPSEVDRLRRHVPDLTTRVFDDVHASPDHLAETREFLFGSLAAMRAGEAAAR